MNELRIHTQIHSRYQVFDASGQLPFSIVFGLCRRSPADVDPRSLLLEIAGSVLDVPYALAHGLLTLHEQDVEDTKQWVEVDPSRLNKVATKTSECLSLPSPVNRREHWRDSFIEYQYQVDPDSELASILEPAKTYVLRLANQDLGVKRWMYSDRKQLADNNGKPSHDFETVKLVNSKPTAGHATFVVVKSLPWPPRIETRMHLCASSTSSESEPSKAKGSSRTVLEVSVTNTSSESVTLQTRGHHRFLVPWGPFQPEPGTDDDRMRIIDATPHKAPTSSLEIIDATTGELVRGSEQRGTGPLVDSNADRRPKVEDLVTLVAGVPVIRKINIGVLLDGLNDGKYRIRMQSKGCRWWRGEVGKDESEDGRIPAHLGDVLAPALKLESQDEIKLCIIAGNVDQST